MLDNINGLFNFAGAFFAWINVKQVITDKRVEGYSIYTFIFFLVWSIWSMFYYTELKQTLSFFGTIGIVTANVVWLVCALYYKGTK